MEETNWSIFLHYKFPSQYEEKLYTYFLLNFKCIREKQMQNGGIFFW